MSRVGLIENLRDHLLASRWAAMVGGPMIGKSTLARNLAEQLKQNGVTPLSIGLKGLAAPSAFWSALMEAILYQGIGPAQKNPYRKNPKTLPDLMTQLHHIYEKLPPEVAARPIVILLDDCDDLLLLRDPLVPQIINMAMESVSPSIHSICWIGGPAWETWITDHRDELKHPIRLYPLSVIPIREAKKIIQDYLGPERADQAERIWGETGGHPYLLEKMFDLEKIDLVDTLSKRLLGQLKPQEKALLHQLDRSGNWTILNELKMEDGRHPPKELLDRLCMLGLIVRTLMEGTAAVRVISPLLMKAT